MIYHEEAAMILSRANLQVLDVASRDPKDRELYQVHVGRDGCTVASDGAVLMGVEGMSGRPSALPTFSGEQEAEAVVRREDGVGIPPAVAHQARRDLPKGALALELGFVALTKVEEGRGGGVELTSTDLTRHLKVEGRKARGRFPEWVKVLRQMRPPGEAVHRVCVDRRSLVRLLKAFDGAAPDPEGAIFLEVPVGGKGGVVLRARNVQTGQAVIGMCLPLGTRGEWLEMTAWERGVFGEKLKPVKRKRKK